MFLNDSAFIYLGENKLLIEGTVVKVCFIYPVSYDFPYN